MISGETGWGVDMSIFMQRNSLLVLAFGSGVVFLSCVTTLIENQLNFRSPVNLIWMVGIPAALGFLVPGGAIKRIVAAAIYVLMSVVSSILFVYFYWGGV
jgi:hypothetical protein